MAIREWQPNTAYRQGDCVLIPDGSGGYMGDANGSKTWLLCCVGSGSSPDTTAWGVSGSSKTQTEWATLFEGTGTDGNVTEATVLPATLSAGSGPDGTIRWGLGIAYFLDTANTTSAGTGTYAAPYNAASQITAGQITTQDGTNSTRHLYVKRGTLVTLTSSGAQWLGRGSSRRMYATLSDYGAVTRALPKLDATATIPGGTAGVLIYKASSNPARYVRAENFEVCYAGSDGVSIYLGTAESAIAQNDIIVEGVWSHHNKAAGIQAITGGDIDRTTSSTGIYIRNNTCTDNAIYGVAVREWWDGGEISGNFIANNGLSAPSGAYGISTIGNYKSYSVTGWTSLGSNTWSRAMTRTGNLVEGRWRDASGNEKILALGTYGSLSTDYTIANSGGTIQVRLGAGDDPNTTSCIVYACYNQVKNIDVADNDVNDTHDYRAAASRNDGDGIGIDQFSRNVRVFGNRIRGNGGGGLVANQPTGLSVFANVIERNGAEKSAAAVTIAAVLINHPQGTVEVLQNTIAESYGSGVRVYSPNGVSVTVQGNIIENSDAEALYGTLSVSGITSDYNALSGNASSTTNASLGSHDSTTTSTARDARGCPTDSTARSMVPYPARRDLYRKRFQSPASVGAVQYQPAATSATTAAGSRTAAGV